MYSVGEDMRRQKCRGRLRLWRGPFGSVCSECLGNGWRKVGSSGTERLGDKRVGRSKIKGMQGLG